MRSCYRYVPHIPVHVNNQVYKLTYRYFNSLSVLGWYIPGLSELPLEHHLLRLLAGESLFYFFFFRLVPVRVPRARHRGRARLCRGCQRVLAGKGGVGRSAVAVCMARRHVSIEIRGKHE